MVDPLETYPFLSSSQKLLPQLLLANMILDGVRIQRIDWNRPLEGRNDDSALDSTEGLPKTRLVDFLINRVSIRDAPLITVVVDLVDGVDALAKKIVEADTHGLDLGRGDELECSRLPGRRALCDEDGARNHDGIEEVEGNLAVSGEVLDLGDRTTIVLAEIVEEDTERVGSVGLFGGSGLLALQFGQIRLELGKECEE